MRTSRGFSISGLTIAILLVFVAVAVGQLVQVYGSGQTPKFNVVSMVGIFVVTPILMCGVLALVAWLICRRSDNVFNGTLSVLLLLISATRVLLMTGIITGKPITMPTPPIVATATGSPGAQPVTGPSPTPAPPAGPVPLQPRTQRPVPTTSAPRTPREIDAEGETSRPDVTVPSTDPPTESDPAVRPRPNRPPPARRNAPPDPALIKSTTDPIRAAVNEEARAAADKVEAAFTSADKTLRHSRSDLEARIALLKEAATALEKAEKRLRGAQDEAHKALEGAGITSSLGPAMEMSRELNTLQRAAACRPIEWALEPALEKFTLLLNRFGAWDVDAGGGIRTTDRDFKFRITSLESRISTGFSRRDPSVRELRGE